MCNKLHMKWWAAQRTLVLVTHHNITSPSLYSLPILKYITGRNFLELHVVHVSASGPWVFSQSAGRKLSMEKCHLFRHINFCLNKRIDCGKEPQHLAKETVEERKWMCWGDERLTMTPKQCPWSTVALLTLALGNTGNASYQDTGNVDTR